MSDDTKPTDKMFYGPDEITNVEVVGKTEKGQELAEITIGEDTKIRLPQWVLVKVMTPEASDYTTLRNERCNLFAYEIIKTLLDCVVSQQEGPYLFEKVAQSIDMNIQKANDKLWGLDYQNKTILDIHEVMSDDEQSKE